MAHLERVPEDNWVYELVREHDLEQCLAGRTIRWCQWIRIQIQKQVDPFGDPEDFYQEVVTKLFLTPGELWRYYKPEKGLPLENFFLRVATQSVERVARNRLRRSKKHWVAPLGSRFEGMGVRLTNRENPLDHGIFRAKITNNVDAFAPPEDSSFRTVQGEFERFLSRQRESETLLRVYRVRIRQEPESELENLDINTLRRMIRRLRSLTKTFFE